MSELTNIAELLDELDVKDTRIAALEAKVEHDEGNLDGLEHALMRANQRYTKAEAALAERDAKLEWALGLNACAEHERAVWAEAEASERGAMLRRAYNDDPALSESGANPPGPNYTEWLADLRARAEEGN